MICKFCGSPNDDDNFICDNCGKPFDDELDLEALKDHRPKTISFDDEIVEPIFESQKQAKPADSFVSPVPERAEEKKPSYNYPPISIDDVPESFKEVLYGDTERNRTSAPEKVRTVEYDNTNSPVEETISRRPLFNEEDLEPDEEEAKRQELRVMNNFKRCAVCGALIKDGSNKSMCSDCFNAKIESMVASDSKDEKGKGKIKLFTAIALSVLVLVLIAFVVLMMFMSSGAKKQQNRNDYDALQSAIKEDERQEAMNSDKYSEEEEETNSDTPIQSDIAPIESDSGNAGDIFEQIQGNN